MQQVQSIEEDSVYREQKKMNLLYKKFSINKKLLKIMAKEGFNRKAQLVVKDVAWVDEKPIKYQAFLEYKVSDKRTIRICGDPQSTKDKAIDSLCAEKILWEEAISEFRELKI